MGMPGLTGGMFCDLSPYLTGLPDLQCFILHIYLTLILAMQKCLLQLVFMLHGFDNVHRQMAMLRSTLVLDQIYHCDCCT